MKTESPPPKEYPFEKDANFALFHFVGSVDNIQDFILKEINQHSVEEIEDFKEAANAATPEKRRFIITSPPDGWRDINKAPKKALCCSLAISSPAPEDQLKIEFYSKYGLIKGVGVVIEDPNKVLVPHADYFALNSHGNLPLPLKKEELSGFNFLILPDRNINPQSSPFKPIRVDCYTGRWSKGINLVTNYASYDRQEKRVLENRGGEKGFINFARNFYRTSLRGNSGRAHRDLQKKPKYYPLDEATNERPKAGYTELLVYQKKEGPNPIAGVVLDMNVLTLKLDDLDKLKELFRLNRNLALYIYDTNLQADYIRKITEKQKILEHLESIGKIMTPDVTGQLSFSKVSSRDGVKVLNSALQPLNNKILVQSQSDDKIKEAGSEPQIARQDTIEEAVKKSFKPFFDSLTTKEQVLDFLIFLWGGGGFNQEYDGLKTSITGEHKVKFIGDDQRKELEAHKFINDFNRQNAIEKLMELNQAELDQGKKQETENFIATYRQIYSQLRLDVFLEQDEFNLGKTEMRQFCSTKTKSSRLEKIDEVKALFNGTKIDDSEILSFFSSLQSKYEEIKSPLQKIWDDHEHAIKDDACGDSRRLLEEIFCCLRLRLWKIKNIKQSSKNV